MPQSIIKKIRVKDLFGKFSYAIPEKESMMSPVILYGDNGVGKSTILNLAFHALSAANDRGHRTAMKKVAFKEFTVELSDGTVVSATRENNISDEILDLKIFVGNKLRAQWISGQEDSPYILVGDELVRTRFDDNDDRLTETYLRYARMIGEKNSKKDGVARGNHAYIRKLEQVAPRIYYLNADRKLDSDDVADATDTTEIRRMITSREMKRTTDILRLSRGNSLLQALENAARWVNRRAVSDANRGSENTHSAYESILNQIAIDYIGESNTIDAEKIKNLILLVERIEEDTKNYSKYELAAELKMEKFKSALGSQNDQSVSISAKLIQPYVEGLSKRLEAIAPLYQVLNSFVSTINGFLNGKRISYRLSQGFYIVDDNGENLQPHQLSSGEQQLLLIFSYVLAARDVPSVFIIDEPEISLNIKWQRKIVRSLLSVAEQSMIQFVFASHSLELIAQHSDAVVEIGR